jgi:AmmeMemoRadiSam system protein A
VFVTLHRQGRLRGCIGYIEGIKPLAEAVVDNGRSAAVGDPRFAPVTAGELDQLEIEVSALTPLRPVSGPEDIEIGRHGIVLAKGGRRAVFLPQVAPEQGWDLTTTLGHLALKAGLGPDGWQEGARFEVFEAEVF